jgi:hypothetical protein
MKTKLKNREVALEKTRQTITKTGEKYYLFDKIVCV